MRRKLFFVAVISILLILFFDSINICLKNFDVEISDSVDELYEGEIISIQQSEDQSYNLLVKINNENNILVKYYGNDISQEYYAKQIRFSAVLQEPQGQRNPKCFNYKKYLKSIGIIATCNIQKFELISTDENIIDIINRFILVKRDGFLLTIEDEETRAFISGILFGNTTFLEEDVYEDFRKNGTAHILAVSGLHMGIIYSLVEKITGKQQSLLKLIITFAVLYIFGTAASWAPSVIRASGMIILKIVAMYLDRRYDIITSASIMAIIMMLHNPYIVFNTGFQMSFIAVLSIAFIMPHMPRMIPDFLAVILAVNIGLLPYQIYVFNSLSLTSIIANIPVVYVSGLLIKYFVIFFFLFWLGFESGIIDIFLRCCVDLLVNLNEILTFGIEDVDVISPPIGFLILVYGTFFFLISESFAILYLRKNLTKIGISVALIVAISIFGAAIEYDDFSKCQIVFIDVGQGASVHIKAGKTDVLIDGGGRLEYNVGKNILKPYLLKNGIAKVDLAIATHLHTDHYKGLEELKDEGLLAEIKSGLTSGKEYVLAENVKVRALWPLPNIDGTAVDQDENKNCSVFMIYYKNTKILITGDLDAEGEEDMVDYYSGTDTLKADILAIGHHGSKYSTSDLFLDTVNPSYAVIQVGKNNYGHPEIKIIEKCFERSIIILRNDISGAIGFFVQDEKLDYKTII